MKVFSNRYDKYALREISIRNRSYGRSFSESSPFRRSVLSDILRTRITHLLKYIVSTDEFLEPFILLKDEEQNKQGLYVRNLKDFSEAELGYNITENLDPDTMEIHIFDSDGEEQINDSILLDLIEVLIVLSKDDKRDELTSRLNSIFNDESATFIVSGWMIIPTNQVGIGPLLPLIKNPTLKEKLNAVRSPGQALSAQAKARNAADAVQYIFSSEKKGDTKSDSEKLLMDVAKRWTDPARVNDLYDLLNQQVNLAKSFNNQIGNIRHTDKHTIDIEGPGMFDMIYKINMSVTELTLVTEQEKYIEEKPASELKQEYSNNYQIDLKQSYVRKKKEVTFDLSEIPF